MIMSYKKICPECYSRDVEENSELFHRVLQGATIGLGIITGHGHLAGHAISQKYHKYHCNKCGKDFD